MTRAAIYLRQSLDRSGQALAVERQRSDCRKLVRARGWTVAEEFVDNDVSASSGKPRPAYQRLLAEVRAGRIDAVVAWAPDRLLRRPIELEELVNLVEQQGLAVATVSGGEYDLGTPNGRAVARIYGAIARQEVEQKGARQKRANLQRAEAGRTPFTRRPFGYSDDGADLVESEAEEVRKAAKAVLAGATLMSLAADLNRRGVPTSTSGRWSVTTLRRILLNPRYAGLATYKGQITTEGSWPAAYDRDTHEQLALLLTNPSRLRHQGTQPKYLLTGLVRCGLCGDRMFASPMGQKDRRWMVYRCRKTHLMRRLDYVDKTVVRAILDRLSAPNAIDLFAPEPDDIAARREDALSLRRRLDTLAELFAEGLVTAEALRVEGTKLRDRLEDAERRLQPSSVSGAMTELVGAKDVEKTWTALDLRTQRQVVDLLLEATVLPVGKGARFSPEQVRLVWR